MQCNIHQCDVEIWLQSVDAEVGGGGGGRTGVGDGYEGGAVDRKPHARAGLLNPDRLWTPRSGGGSLQRGGEFIGWFNKSFCCFLHLFNSIVLCSG